MITDAKSQALQQVNKILINLYWNIGRYVNEKAQKDGWGKGVVEELSSYITSENPSIKGFSARNIWRMKQFYETYTGHPKLSTLLTEVGWSVVRTRFVWLNAGSAATSVRKISLGILGKSFVA